MTASSFGNAAATAIRYPFGPIPSDDALPQTRADADDDAPVAAPQTPLERMPATYHRTSTIPLPRCASSMTYRLPKTLVIVYCCAFPSSTTSATVFTPGGSSSRTYT